MIEAARLAASQIFTPPFRGVLLKSLALTIGILAAVWFGLTGLIDTQVVLTDSLWDKVVTIVAGLGLFVGVVFLIVPVTALVAGLYLDDIAEVVETRYYAHEGAGKALPFGEAIWTAVKFMLVVIAVNLLALLLLVIGIGIPIFFLANGYLLGREFFELATLRFRSQSEMRALRRQHKLAIFLSGLIIAGLLAVPVLNLLAPLFATAMMVHLHKRLTGSTPSADATPQR